MPPTLPAFQACDHFVPNQWRRTLCQNCFQGYSAHASTNEQDKKPPQRWYFAKVEGPFTWEQMRHWYEAGYFDKQGLILVKQIPGDLTSVEQETAAANAHTFEWIEDTFPDSDTAFIPEEAAQEAQRAGTEISAAANVLDGQKDENQIDPSVLRDHSLSVAAYFSRGDEWYFIDANGEQQGPFSARHMITWYEAGYFWNKDLLISHAGWDHYSRLQDLMTASLDVLDEETMARAKQLHAELIQDQQSPSRSPSSMTRSASKRTPTNDLQQHEAVHTDMSINSPITSSNSNSEVIEQIRQLNVAYHDGIGRIEQTSKQSPETIKQEKNHKHEKVDGGENLDSSRTNDSYDSYNEEDNEPEWYYIDPQNQTQGPFSTVEMMDWFSWGYFSPSTRIKHIDNKYKSFVPMEQLFEPGHEFDFPENWHDRYVAATTSK